MPCFDKVKKIESTRPAKRVGAVQHNTPKWPSAATHLANLRKHSLLIPEWETSRKSITDKASEQWLTGGSKCVCVMENNTGK